MEEKLPKFLEVIAGIGGLSGLAALLAVLVNWYTQRTQARKTSADTEKTKAETMGVVVDGAGDLVEHYRRLVGEMSAQMGELKKTQDQHTRQLGSLHRTVALYAQRIAYLTGGIHQLINQINCLDETPVWTPDENWEADGSDTGRETPMPPVR